MSCFCLTDGDLYTLLKSLGFILSALSCRTLQSHIFDMIQQWLLKIGNEITNGNIELLRHVCIRMALRDSICFGWGMIFFREKQGPSEAGTGKCKLEASIVIIQMIFNGEWKSLSEGASHDRTRYLSVTEHSSTVSISWHCYRNPLRKMLDLPLGIYIHGILFVFFCNLESIPMSFFINIAILQLVHVGRWETGTASGNYVHGCLKVEAPDLVSISSPFCFLIRVPTSSFHCFPLAPLFHCSVLFARLQHRCVNFFKVFFCQCVWCVCPVCMRVHKHMHEHVCRDHRVMVDVFLSLCLLRSILS